MTNVPFKVEFANSKKYLIFANTDECWNYFNENSLEGKCALVSYGQFENALEFDDVESVIHSMVDTTRR